MALFPPLPQRRPFFSALSLALALTLPVAAAGPEATKTPAIAPSLGWLGGELGSPSRRASQGCDGDRLKSGLFAKVDRHLAAVFCNRERRSASGQAMSSDLAPVVEQGGELLVAIDAASHDPEGLAAEVRTVGAREVSVYGPMVSAWFPVARIDVLAEMSQLRFARAASATVNAGSVTGQHVAALEITDLAAAGLDGSGVSIGVLSDSYDCLGGAAADIVSNDLPAGATALLDEAGCASGTDEGRAMMQLIHDVVPGSAQTFHTAFGGQATFASGIQALATAGASVIVDDVTYFAEPMFQDGIIAQAVDSVATVDNVAYFSAAGNGGDNSYEHAFDDSGVGGPGAGTLHDFDPGAGVDTRQQITVPTGTTNLILNWDQPYFSATGGSGSATDLDIHLYQGATYLFSAADGNIGGDPIEILGITNNGAPIALDIEIEYFDGPMGATPIPTFVKYVLLNSTTIDEYATNSGTAFGHSNADGAITVGAANYWQTPGFGVDPAVIATYSAHGGVGVRFDLADLPIGPLDRAKPEIVGPDGANTTFFGSDINEPTDPDTFPNFFGTSAAAPAVAAIAGMMKQTRPAIAPAEVESCLVQTAADMGLAGYDDQTGNGWVRPRPALICAHGDWGDLPDSFGTTDASSGATHGLIVSAYLGAAVDDEMDGSPDSAAAGDDAVGDDEDGIVFLDPIVPSQPARIQVTASAAGFLNAWIDFDGDLAFGAGEQVRSDAPIPAGTSIFQVTAPPAASGVMYSRFRFSTDDPAGALGPTGAWLTGEVEDYALASIGNRVWNDDGSGGGVAGDGLQNGSEPGLSGASALLLDAGGGLVTDAVGTPIEALTDGNGIYELPGVVPGSYRLQFDLPPGPWGFSPADAGDDALDSDPNITTGRTAPFGLTAGQVEATIDAGAQLATLALIDRFSARRDGRGVLVEWETSSEAGTLAFEVFRREGGLWRRVSDQPVPAMLAAPQGGTYSLSDAGAGSESPRLEYALAEIESNGQVRFHGPYLVTPTEERRRDAAPLAATELPSPRAHQRAPGRLATLPAPARPGAPPVGSRAGSSRRLTAVAVPIARTGLVSVSARALADALERRESEVLAAIRDHDLRLTFEGEDVPWHGEAKEGAVLFYGEHRPSLYSNETFYRLELGSRGVVMDRALGGPPDPFSGGWFDEVLEFEQDLLPAIAATEETGTDYWHWGGVIAGHPSAGSADFSLRLPGLVPAGSATITARLIGGSRGPVRDEHRAEVRVNGEVAGRVRWDDKARTEATFDLDPTWLAGDTTVTVEGLAGGPGSFSLFFIEGFEVAYRRELRAVEDRLRFVIGARGVASVEGFSGSDLVAVDVTDPRAPRIVSELKVDGGPTNGGETYRGTIAAPAGHRIEMVRAKFTAASGLRAIAPSPLVGAAGAEYVIVAPRELTAAARELADYRRADGLSTLVIDIERLYDEFTASQRSPWAVREFLTHAMTEWPVKPRYVVLAGAGTFDPRDILGNGDSLLAPVLLGTPQGLAAADNLLADVDADGLADVAIGRLPV